METLLYFAEALSKQKITDKLLSGKLVNENQVGNQNSYFVRNERGDFDVIETEYF